MKISMTESEYESLIDSNCHEYWITAVWTSREYKKGHRPKDLEGVLEIIRLEWRK